MNKIYFFNVSYQVKEKKSMDKMIFTCQIQFKKLGGEKYRGLNGYVSRN